MKKRLIGILLTVMIIAGIAALFAIPVSAADTCTYYFGEDLSGTQFIKDAKVNDRNFTINLQGHTWTLTEEVDTYDLDIGRLRIENGTVRTSGMAGKYGFEIWGGLELESVNFDNCTCSNLFYFSGVSYGENACSIRNCNFRDGTFTGNGGVFYFNVTDGDLTSDFYLCNFINCKTTKSGGALYFNNLAPRGDTDSYVFLNGCNFLDCHANGDGGAIYINEDVNIGLNVNITEKSYFGECTADGSGGAIYNNYGNGRISDCIFYGCQASGGYGGGAILLDEYNSKINNCEFYGCNAPNGKGAAIWSDGKDSPITGCIFEGNGIIPGAAQGVQQRSTYYSYYENSIAADCYFSNPYNLEGGVKDTNINFHYWGDPCVLSADNYNGNTLIRGDSPENPIIIKTYDDFKAIALNVIKIDETDHWSDKYYRLETDINDWYLRFEVKDGHLDGNGHIVNTRLAKSFAIGNAGDMRLIEDGDGGYSNFDIVDQNGNKIKFNTLDKPLNSKHYYLDKNMTHLGDGWYIVYTDVTYDDNVRLEVSGNVSILLLDGCTLTVNGGIHTNSNSRLNIFSEHIDTSDNNNMGTLRIDAPDTGGRWNSSNCAIGTNVRGKEENVVVSIFGGYIDVNSRGDAPAIGVAGDQEEMLQYMLAMVYGSMQPLPMVTQSMDINIRNGYINATTLSSAPAIGSHYSYGTMSIDISGGKIKAKNNSSYRVIGNDYNHKTYFTRISGGDFYFVESTANEYIDSENLDMTGGTIHTEKHTEHVWIGGECQICRVKCAHEWNGKGVCDICKMECVHEWDGKGVCTNCNMECAHIWDGKGVCTVCNMVCVHEWDGKGVCTNCEMECAHIWDGKGVCTNCKMECSHIWDDKGVCSICTYHCLHDWKDGKCTICLYECHHNGDTCALCGKTIVSESGDFLASVLSEGSLVIICSVACLAVGFLASMFVFKKKQSALARSNENKDEK